MLKIKKHVDGEMVTVATYEDGEFVGNPELKDGLGTLEGLDEEELMDRLNGPNLIAIRPADADGERGDSDGQNKDPDSNTVRVSLQAGSETDWLAEGREAEDGGPSDAPNGDGGTGDGG